MIRLLIPILFIIWWRVFQLVFDFPFWLRLFLSVRHYILFRLLLSINILLFLFSIFIIISSIFMVIKFIAAIYSWLELVLILVVGMVVFLFRSKDYLVGVLLNFGLELTILFRYILWYLLLLDIFLSNIISMIIKVFTLIIILVLLLIERFIWNMLVILISDCRS